jgi:hypothetical protein
MSQQAVVAVATTLAVVAVILDVVVLWPLESVAMAITRGKQSHSLLAVG